MPVVDLPADDQAVTKNVIGRLNTAAVAKSTMTTTLVAIRRAAGLDIPPGQQPAAPKHSKKPIIKVHRSQLESTPGRSPSLSNTIPSPAFTRSDAPVPESDVEEEEGSQSDEELPNTKSTLLISPKRTAFLPALSIGYIPAIDDSDPDEEYNSFEPLKKMRKNRRGQRERQAIWLKKYGSNARHLHPELKDTNHANSKKVSGKIVVDRSSNQPSETPVATEVVKKVNDPHPSWVAKQKLREQQEAMTRSVKPQKIVFD
jgi:BUD22